MPRDLDHLELPRVRGTLPRKLHGFGRPPARPDKRQHGEHLLDKAQELSTECLRHPRPTGISPTLIFRLVLHQQADVDETELGRMGLTVICREPDRTIVVFSSDLALEAFRRYISEYAGLVPEGHAYNFIASVEDLLPLGPEDRVGRLLRNDPIGHAETAQLDVEIMHPGSRDQCRQYLDELSRLAVSQAGRLTDLYIGDYLCLARCHLNEAGLQAFLNVDYILEIDRKPRPTFDTALLYQTTLGDLGIIPEAPEDASGILVIDSGVMGNHPLLRPALGEAEVFPDRLRQRLQGGPEDAEGHGTSVCGIAVYGDVGRCIETATFRPTVRLFSARVLDENREYDSDELVEHQFEQAVRHFVNRYPRCKVINVSLGDDHLFLREGQKQFRLAATIDQLAYDLREQNVLFVISAGNYMHSPNAPDRRLIDYPGYLFDEEARVIDPATSALGVSVGSLSTGNVPFRHNTDASRRCIAGKAEFPSPFTRTGFGVDGMIKPDLVEFGGDEVFDPLLRVIDPGAGIPTTSKDFMPPEGQIFRAACGTSFAAPAVAHTAARLFDRFPGATSNLVRALMADSARIPIEPPPNVGRHPWDDGVLKVYGYGRPSFERAAYSDQNEVLLVAEEEIPVNSFQLFEIPPLPNEFLDHAGERYLSVTLAYDPPTRHTRGDSYVGLTMESHMFRNISAQTVEYLFRDWAKAPAEENEAALEEAISKLPSSQRIDLMPGINRRKKGTLQKGIIRIGSSRWTYNRDPIILSVACIRKWAPEEIDSQRYAVVVSVRHSSDEIRLYDRIRQHVRVAQRIRMRV